MALMEVIIGTFLILPELNHSLTLTDVNAMYIVTINSIKAKIAYT